MLERKIEVVKCGELFGCAIEDRISIELSPSDVEGLTYIFEQRALAATRYGGQGVEREMCDLFRRAYKKWREARRKLEEESK